MAQKRRMTSIALVCLLVGALPLISLAAPEPAHVAQDAPTNLLKNPGFEGLSCAPSSAPGWCEDNWTHDVYDGSFHDNIFTPQGWTTWWRKGGSYGQPEVKTIPNDDPFIGPPARVHSGQYAMMLFTFYRDQDTGAYQTVTGLEPGADVQFSCYGQGFSCSDSDSGAMSCGDPWNQWFKVGIEPNGVADPFSPSVIWSPDQLSPDVYNLIGPVTAKVGPNGSVAVFTRSETKWGYKHQDAYWDDCSLVVTSPSTPPTPTPLPAPPTATPGPSPTPGPPPTPRPDGAVVHTVQSGDTLFGLALDYGVETNQIRQLNAGSIYPGDIIAIGQELVISVSTPQATAEPTADPSEAEANPAAAQPTAGASICVSAFHDRNADVMRDEANEELLPSAEFTLADATGVIDRYVSDGISEPHCFSGLIPGVYRVIQVPPVGYAPSGSAERDVAVGEGTTLPLQFGSVRDEAALSAEEEAGSEEANENPDANSDGGFDTRGIFSIVAKVSGILVLVLAAGTAVLFFVTRRRM
jgi:LysM repeat protein